MDGSSVKIEEITRSCYDPLCLGRKYRWYKSRCRRDIKIVAERADEIWFSFFCFWILPAVVLVPHAVKFADSAFKRRAGVFGVLCEEPVDDDVHGEEFLLKFDDLCEASL